MEDSFTEKSEETDESLIVLYADNERLEKEVQDLNAKLKQCTLGVLSGGAPAETSTVPSKEDPLRVSKVSTDASELNNRILDLEENIAAVTRKLAMSEDREASLQKKLEAQKERVTTITGQLSELTAKNDLLKEEKAEVLNDKAALEKELEAARAATKLAEEKHAEQLKNMEKLLQQKRARIFRPAKKVNALQTKIDLAAQVQGLKKTHSPFLEST
jgi:septal ring factor EnvC (AmiA/AmiB activator)